MNIRLFFEGPILKEVSGVTHIPAMLPEGWNFVDYAPISESEALSAKVKQLERSRGSWKAKSKRLEERVKKLKAALQYVEHRTDPIPAKGPHPHGFIRSTRMRAVIVEALAEEE